MAPIICRKRNHICNLIPNPMTRTKRTKRLESLLNLVLSGEYRRQDELVKGLQDLGFDVTQSSISRDIRALGLKKTRGVYGAPADVLAGPAEAKVLEQISHIASAGDHLLVIKTPIAAAQAVGVAIDKAQWPGVVGTVAGDDTVFVAVANGAASRDITRRVRTVAALD